MFSRTWHGIVPLKMRAAFEQYEYQTGVKDTLAIKGNRGAIWKIIEQGEYAHFFSLYKVGYNGLHDCLCRAGTGDCGDLSRG